MGKLWDEYFTKALADEMHGTSVAMSRVVTIDKSIPYGMDIFPHEHAIQLVGDSPKVALGQCQCRFSVQKCDAPLDVCIMLNNWADYTIERGLAVEVSKGQAIDALRRADEAGLVPTTTNTKGPVPYICNCCPCCCFMLRGVVEFKQSTLATSSFLAVVDEDACTGCGECVERCPFDAMVLDDEDKAETSAERCYGCGVCSSTCPAEAISMTRRTESPEPFETGQSLILDIARDKRKT
jgi:Pyruvate/2-oxoacid:ferredoxin oxidoreductase delta subunit